DEVERGEGVLPESPDGERGSSLRDVHAEGGLQTRTVWDRRVEHGLRDRDVLPRPLREPHDERIELLRVVELEVRRDGAVLAVVDVERHADAVARDIFDLNVRHDDVDRAVPDEVSIHVVEDAFLRHGMELDAEFPEEAVDDAPQVVLLPGAVRVVEHLEVLHEDLFEDIEDFRLLLDQLGLDRLVEVLVRHRVVQDPDVREILQDRLDFDLVHVPLNDLRDRRDLAEARLLDAAHLRRLDLDALVPEDAVPEAVHHRRDEERDPDLVDDPRQVLGQRALDRAARRGQRAARLEHLRQERHVQNPDRHEEDHEGNVNHRDVRRHRDSALILGQLVLLRVVADHRQDVGDVAPRIGGLDDDGDDPPDHRGLHALRKEAQRL